MLQHCYLYFSWAKAITEASRPNSKTDIWLDISTHNVSIPALSIKFPDCHGILTKMGGRRKTWKRRYCVLKDACLYYYKDIDAPQALGKFARGWEIKMEVMSLSKMGGTRYGRGDIVT